MQEPVILPSSQMTIDLATIKSHLLSDTHDPFNRQPLKIEDVVPNVELKAKIMAWRANVTSNNE
jgi:ubiquitin conjugation factor E4 B